MNPTHSQSATSQINLNRNRQLDSAPSTVNQQKLSADLARIRQLAQLMDNQFRVPGTNIRFGLDSIIGLVPGIGDVVTSAVPLWIIYQAQQAGVSRWTLTRMISNVAVDTVVGLIPLVGDAFDIIWKANAKNLKLLERELSRRKT